MPRYQFPVTQDGLTLRVRVGLDQQSIGRLLSTGQAVPHSILVDGLIDTGSDYTGVSAVVIAQLGLPYITTVQTQTASGAAFQRQFWAGVGFPPSNQTPQFQSWHPQLIVNELVAPPDGFDILIGMNLLREGVLIVDGPNNWFVIDF